MGKKKKAGIELLTWKVAEDSGSFLMMDVFVLGTDAWIIHDNDSHMFKLSESPTNIIFFPPHLLRNSIPSNLQTKKPSR